MDGPGKEFLAGAAFAGDENRGIAGRNLKSTLFNRAMTGESPMMESKLPEAADMSSAELRRCRRERLCSSTSSLLAINSAMILRKASSVSCLVPIFSFCSEVKATRPMSPAACPSITMGQQISASSFSWGSYRGSFAGSRQI